MKVRVKEGQKGFIYGSLRRGDNPDRGPDEFTLKSFEHPRKLDAKGKPLVVSVEQQFSRIWMESLEKPEVIQEDSTEDSIEESPVKKTAKKKAKK